MAATALVKDVLWRVSVALLDTTPQFARYAERNLVNALNDAQMAINTFVPTAAARVDSIKLEPGSLQRIGTIPAASCKPSEGATPVAPIFGTRFLNPRRNMGSNGATPGPVVRVVDRTILDNADPNWHTRTGSTVKAVVTDPQTPRHFYVTPAVPQSPDVWMEFAYEAMPLVIPNPATVDADGVHEGGVYGIAQPSTQTITVTDEYVDDLVNYVVAVMLMGEAKHNDPSLATLHAKLFVDSINAKVLARTGSSPGLKHLPLAPVPAGTRSA